MPDAIFRDRLFESVQTIALLRHSDTYCGAVAELLDAFELMTREYFFALADAYLEQLGPLERFDELREKYPDDEVRQLKKDELRRRRVVATQRNQVAVSNFNRQHPEPAGAPAPPHRRTRRTTRGPPRDGKDDDPHDFPRNSIRFRWQLAVRDSSALTSTQKLVALVYATYMDADGTKAFPSAQTLASATRLAPSTIKRTRGELEREGWLIPHRRAGRSTVYAAGFAQGVSQEDPLVAGEDPGVSQRDCRGATGRPDVSPDVALSPPKDTAQEAQPLRWRPVRRDQCWKCDHVEQVDGVGVCEQCWTRERAA